MGTFGRGKSRQKYAGTARGLSVAPRRCKHNHAWAWACASRRLRRTTRPPATDAHYYAAAEASDAASFESDVAAVVDTLSSGANAAAGAVQHVADALRSAAGNAACRPPSQRADERGFTPRPLNYVVAPDAAAKVAEALRSRCLDSGELFLNVVPCICRAAAAAALQILSAHIAATAP